MTDRVVLKNTPSCPLPIGRHKTVQLSHGSGGRMMHALIRDLFLREFADPALHRIEDCATLPVSGRRLAFSTDSYVVDPVFFPGGNIGELAVNGTVNDLSMSGAAPRYLSAGFILEEGLSFEVLTEIVCSMSRAALAAGVVIAAGDTKVVNRGKADKIFINTAGIGLIEHDLEISPGRIRPRDRILLSGTIADHGLAVLSKREGFSFEGPIQSDTAPLAGLVSVMLEAGGPALHALRDPTRGGVASVLNEFAEAAECAIELVEEYIPVRPAVQGACELLGLDPLYVANEGKLLAAVDPDSAETVLNAMRAHTYGQDSVEIGEVSEGPPGLVTLRTRIGARRIVDMLVGEQLPRIC